MVEGSIPLPSMDDIPALLAFLCPGVAFIYGRSVFLSGANPHVDKDTVGGILVVSLVYAIAVWVIFDTPALYLRTLTSSDRWHVAAYALLGPFALGCVYGLLERISALTTVLRCLSEKTNINLPRTPSGHFSAWDALWGDYLRSGDCVAVTPIVGETMYGILGPKSHASASSDNVPDDLLIDELMAIQDDGSLERIEPKKALWIPYSQIKYLEIWCQEDLGEVHGGSEK